MRDPGDQPVCSVSVFTAPSAMIAGGSYGVLLVAVLVI
jgi:hypothetical protein